jgi:signal transduction histidine kinase
MQVDSQQEIDTLRRELEAARARVEQLEHEVASERRRVGRIAMINRIGRMIASRIELDEVVQTAVAAIQEQLGYTSVAVGIVDPHDEQMLTVRAQAGAGRARWAAGSRQRADHGLIGAAARGRRMMLVNDVSRGPRALPLLGANVRAELVAPILSEGRLLGILTIESAAAIDEEDAQGIAIVADHLAIAIDSRRQQVQLAERRQELAVLDERRRLARELHDSVTQQLFGMSLLSQVLPELWQIDRAEALDALGQIRDLTRRALAEMRALLLELRPAELGDQELPHALRDLAAAFGRADLRVEAEVEHGARLPDAVEEALFRIAQEALVNTARHAQARQVRVALASGPPCRLDIADDGRGFAVEQIGHGRFGLVSMRERAVGVGADIQIRSAPGEGTAISVIWPGASKDATKS